MLFEIKMVDLYYRLRSGVLLVELFEMFNVPRMGQGFSFFRLEVIVARSNYVRYDVGSFPIRSQLPMCGILPYWQKFFQN